MKREARKALDEIGINIPRIDVPVARLSGGQRQAIAVARTISGDADIILLDEPLAAMGAKEGAMILDLIARLKAEGNVSIIMILHNYVHVLEACDRVNLIQDGVIALDKPTARDRRSRSSTRSSSRSTAARGRPRGRATATARRRRRRRRAARRPDRAAVSGGRTRSASISAPSRAAPLVLDARSGEELGSASSRTRAR